LRVFGPVAEPILLRPPTGVEVGKLTEVALANAALAVSDANASNSPPEHQGYYVRVARNQQPLVTDYAAVTAGRAVIADALAKCVLLCPAETAEKVLREFEATLLASHQLASHLTGRQ